MTRPAQLELVDPDAPPERSPLEIAVDCDAPILAALAALHADLLRLRERVDQLIASCGRARDA